MIVTKPNKAETHAKAIIRLRTVNEIAHTVGLTVGIKFLDTKFLCFTMGS